MKPTAKTAIVSRLEQSEWLSLFEFKIIGCSEAAISARLREMAKVGIVEGRFRKSENYKEWNLVKPQSLETGAGRVAVDLKWEGEQSSWL